MLLLFDVPGLTGLGYFEALVGTVIAIGVVGAIYAVFGGLRAVAVSDTLNGVGLLIIGVAVPVFGLIALGGGSFAEGLATLSSEHTEKLNAIGDAEAPTPFGTLFTGMIFANLFYWCTNQYVIQRTLGAKSLAEGQKGVLFSGFFKVLVPFMMMIPGVIAFHMYGSGLGTIDEAYPRLIRDVLPFWMSGFFLAVLLGAVFSSFNSLLNSAATLFALDIYGPAQAKRRGDKVPDEQLVRVAKIASIVIALFSFVVAPLLYFSPEGLWQIIRVFTGFYNIPTVVIVIVGLFTARVPALGAKIVIVFHVIAYGLIRFVFDGVITLHFIHVYAVLFAIEVAIMLACGWLAPRERAWSFAPKAQVDMTPWAFARPLAVTLFSCVVAVYLLFSPLGVANVGGPEVLFWALIGGLILVNAAVWIVAVRSGGRELRSVAFNKSEFMANRDGVK